MRPFSPMLQLPGATGAAGSISAAVTTPAASSTFDLTSLGTVDWLHCGLASATDQNRKSGGGSLITRAYSHTPIQWTGAPSTRNTYTWSDGTPTASSTNRTFIYIAMGTAGYFDISVPADLTSRTLVVYFGAATTDGHINASLSDDSAADFDQDLTAATGDRTLTITYNAATAGQTLTVRWSQTSASGNIALAAATLALAA